MSHRRPSSWTWPDARSMLLIPLCARGSLTLMTVRCYPHPLHLLHTLSSKAYRPDIRHIELEAQS